ncbi:MAG: cation:proton antiporter [Bacteroidaceae bacterium]|nr:cation:proton antiporter [Bacteroidaceae bacterium]
MLTIINDLALILIVAGVVSIIFKRLKQPLVLGYIVAGFLAGPHMPYTPTVGDMESVETWSQIGVIFMMFALGLEFSFKKIIKMGFGPVISALCIMACMISIGSGVGWLFGWSSMNRLFLGGMLAMSSTTIIYKAFDDLGLRQKKFTDSVMSVLILEDILGILLMVVLSAVAVSRQFEGGALAMSMLKLGFVLSLWFLVGIFIIPQFLKKNSKYINQETLLIVSVGLCFLLVILASKAGYSPAFGAFMMGSILAETVEAERIEHAIGSVKDLFGAIFFVSVGMLVDPSILVQYWLPILVIVISIILGQCIFGTFSFVLSGNNLRSAIQCGFSMAQIGEFAFIIASLGVSLKVTEEFLYPVVVAVSIITTFLTPYMIKFSQKLSYSKFTLFSEEKKKGKKLFSQNGLLPSSLIPADGVTSTWMSYLTKLFRQTAAYYILTIAAITISFASLLPFCRSLFGHWVGNTICGLITLLVIAPFLRPVIMRKNNSVEALQIRRKSTTHHFIFLFLFFIRFFLATWAVFYVINFLSPFWWGFHVLLAIALVVRIIYSRRIKYYSLKIERTFRQNLSRRDILANENEDNNPRYARRLRARDLHLTRLTIPNNSKWGGKRLSQLQFGREDNVIIVAIIRGDKRINIPGGNCFIFPRDIIEVVGDDASIDIFSKRMETEISNDASSNNSLSITRMVIDASSPFLNKSIVESNIRQQLGCIVIGIEMTDGTLSIANASYVFKLGDIMWLVG